MKHWSAWALVALLGVAGSTWANTADPGIDHREALQHHRIAQGVASGALTRPEARRLAVREHSIAREERAFKRDGKLTLAERATLERRLDRTSRAIYRQKHDAQHR